ncbi:hypothetical protein Tsedi_00566 [Tepidimonas sediminis]|uniref:Uncharacterized protein n=1 Tax=Tepidimonas sediminis TaxID=2588941 RepID=A0A554WTF6_9BURK|nr:hypothetical protein [Tepidimonas sediminis]TSE26857.1 hypothetical protein Tsedi_00566 [Tepidimonas sediminis]
MDVLTALSHLIQLVAPAWSAGALLAGLVAARRRDGAWPRRWARETLWLALPGSAVLVGGLVLTGADGRIATYGALVLLQGALAAWRARPRG